MSSAERLRSATQQMSAQQFLEGPPDEIKSELVHGELVVSPRPSDEHQDLVHDLGELLKRWVRAYELGKVSFDIDMVLSVEKDVVLAPDLLFVSKSHEKRRRKGRLYGPADLCVEVLSPNDKREALRNKFSCYQRYGVSWYWIINPRSVTIEEYELTQGSFSMRSKVSGDEWFAPGLFPELALRLRPLLTGDLKNAVKGKAKKLV